LCACVPIRRTLASVTHSPQEIFVFCTAHAEQIDEYIKLRVKVSVCASSDVTLDVWHVALDDQCGTKRRICRLW
jgi:hypothetical protein